MPARRVHTARTFYLNEQHELAREEKEGGGRLPKLAPIDWAAKARVVSDSLHRVREKLDRSRDPLKGRRYFMLATPTQAVRKKSVNERRAPEGTYDEVPDYAASEYSRVFHRLGIDLLQVNDNGTATVHALPEHMDTLMHTSMALGDLGAREQARWVSIERFDMIPTYVRVDEEWLRSAPASAVQDVVMELQPLLTRTEIDEVVHAIASYLLRENGEALTGTGTDFSGRQWYRGKATPRSLRVIARDLICIQSIHAPLRSLAASHFPSHMPQEIGKPHGIRRKSGQAFDAAQLPTVAIVDTGVPDRHAVLAPLGRGRYISPMSAGRALGDHGSLVASRAVFGDASSHTEAQAGTAGCRYYDVNLAISSDEIDDKSVLPALQAIAATAPDVRVFNLSFDNRLPLSLLSEILRREKLALVQDLDNFIFANDVLVIVGAGNSPRGVVPTDSYPDHYNEPQWSLGPWASSFNSLTCGSTVERPGAEGLVTEVGWPSAFTRVGPGLCGSPKPDFVAHGGNCTNSYNAASGLGVWACNARGLWEDHSGTSYAAPILARTAAFALAELEKVCQPGARPYAVTAKAFLALTAKRRQLSERVKDLAERALGRGYASVQRLVAPSPESAVMVWQGVIDGPRDTVRVQLPIPCKWYDAALLPWLRLVVAWDTPASLAAHHVWGCRRVTVRLAPGLKLHAMYSRGKAHQSYPLIDRHYHLKKLPAGVSVQGDMWLLELGYEQIAAYCPGIDFALPQRVAFAAELWDKAESPVSPQPFLQELPIANTMTRLSVPPVAVRAPIVLRIRG